MIGRWLTTKLCGPAIDELKAHWRAEPTHSRIAAIAGTCGPPGLPLGQPHDGAVCVRSAWAGAGHRAAVRTPHTLLPVSPRAITLTTKLEAAVSDPDQQNTADIPLVLIVVSLLVRR